MKSKVEKILVKRGNNVESVKKMIDENLELAMRMYPEAKAAKLAEILVCL
ncbi:hypothetical protein POP12_125 [Pectobacterium phage POP12]|nr:hypothetical protein POP12_125 [Pectobacterium phage POP12]